MEIPTSASIDSLSSTTHAQCRLPASDELSKWYQRGADSEGRPIMVVVGAHFLLRILVLDTESILLNGNNIAILVPDGSPDPE
ncbi:unnamed protein product [Lactuca virosa]|uniref:Uncharacterized protein n=1 Tax=Lactuca virosa TaxID=75947 RepID=A0AAU9NA69_9ASTR|nr:unnamed protein product [Lactuca virosa]